MIICGEGAVREGRVGVDRVPVILLSGFLGAGKTTVLNHLLRQPGARVGVIVNDFGEINIDASLVSGQIDEPASISGGCLCCLPDAGGLDDALARLTRPRLALDVVIVEASGIAQPEVLARMIRFSSVERVRPGGLIDVVDAVEYFRTVDIGGLVPSRFSVASLVVLNKCDRLPVASREQTLTRIADRVRARNPNAHVVRTSHGRVDPALVYDAASTEEPADQLPIAALLRADACHTHDHAEAVTVQSSGPVDPGRVVDLLENPPTGTYRIKGNVMLRTGQSVRRYGVNLVGRSIHVHGRPRTGTTRTGTNELVAIGMHLDAVAAQTRLTWALAPAGAAGSSGLARLQRYRRLSGYT